MERDELLEAAVKQKNAAYKPYSGLSVGAALLAKSGKVYLGCNIENASFGLTVCAERVAFFKAISEGEREFECIAISGGDGLCPPCGSCRQVMAEFCGPEFEIYVGDKNNYRKFTLGQLLPFPFGRENIED